MSELKVRIVEMEPMHVAVSHGFGSSPEAEAGDKMLAFLAAKGLTFDDVRWYGFNNPNPSPGSPNYGYDVWATIGPEAEVEGDIVLRDIPARRYAVAHCEGLENIGQVWKDLVLWFKDSAYDKPAHWCECLENLLTHPDTPYEQYAFDLYLPIAG